MYEIIVALTSLLPRQNLQPPIQYEFCFATENVMPGGSFMTVFGELVFGFSQIASSSRNASTTVKQT